MPSLGWSEGGGGILWMAVVRLHGAMPAGQLGLVWSSAHSGCHCLPSHHWICPSAAGQAVGYANWCEHIFSHSHSRADAPLI